MQPVDDASRGGAVSRRHFLAGGAAAGALALSPALLREALAAPAGADPSPYGPLGSNLQEGVLMPDGFSARRIARGGRSIAGYPWHFAPDGQATYRTLDGGWILVSNSEAPAPLGGGASAIRFDAAGEVRSAYRILAGTNLNCAGGPTPWGTWLSCEEHEGGMVWECDPAGRLPAVPRPALGNFSHEAAAVDPDREHVYLTEDQSDGGFYRFTPDSYPSLASGVLECAVVDPDGSVRWERVPDPNVAGGGAPVRRQVAEMTTFHGGEGLWYDRGTVYFTTKGDRRVWAYDAGSRHLEVLYDHRLTPTAALNAVDNVTVSPSGDIYVCEDGGNMEVCLITPERTVSPFCRLPGVEHAGSELCGVVFAPAGDRMYFSSQRAHPYVPGTPVADGEIYEVRGPFRVPDGGVPADRVYGPPAGEGGELPGLPVELGDDVVVGDSAAPGLALRSARRVAPRTLARRGLRARVVLSQPATVQLVLRTAALARDRRRDGTHDRPRLVTLARRRVTLPRGSHELTLALAPGAARRLGHRPLDAILTGVARGDGGRRLVATRAVRIGG